MAMRPDIWHNCRTHHTVGVNTILGSPRSWVNRSLGVRKADYDLHDTSLDPRSVSLAGIWPRGVSLPDTGAHHALYRFFDLPEDPRYINSGIARDLRPMVGVAMALPGDLVFECSKAWAGSADWLWWSWPQPHRKKQVHSNLDHQRLYQLFDTGLTHNQVARQENLIPASVKYVWNKWAAGKPPVTKARRFNDHDEIVQRLQAGFTVTQVANEYSISPVWVYKIKNRYGV